MSSDPRDVVQRQLEAYNRRDLEGFLAVFADDAQLFELGSPQPATAGKAAIAARFQELFERSPALHAEVLTRTCFDRAVVDLELVRGRLGSQEVTQLLMVYEVERGLIVHSHAVRKR